MNTFVFVSLLALAALVLSVESSDNFDGPFEGDRFDRDGSFGDRDGLFGDRRDDGYFGDKDGTFFGYGSFESNRFNPDGSVGNREFGPRFGSRNQCTCDYARFWNLFDKNCYRRSAFVGEVYSEIPYNWIQSLQHCSVNNLPDTQSSVLVQLDSEEKFNLLKDPKKFPGEFWVAVTREHEIATDATTPIKYYRHPGRIEIAIPDNWFIANGKPTVETGCLRMARPTTGAGLQLVFCTDPNYWYCQKPCTTFYADEKKHHDKKHHYEGGYKHHDEVGHNRHGHGGHYNNHFNFFNHHNNDHHWPVPVPVPVVPGPAGKDGKDGKDGRDGRDGQVGKDGKRGDNGYQSYPTIVYPPVEYKTYGYGDKSYGYGDNKPYGGSYGDNKPYGGSYGDKPYGYGDKSYGSYGNNKPTGYGDSPKLYGGSYGDDGPKYKPDYLSRNSAYED